MSRLIKGLQAVVTGIVFLFLIGLGISSTKTMPKNTIILLDHTNKQFLAPACVLDPSYYSVATVHEAHELNYHANPNCRDQGAFGQEGRSLSGIMLEKLGLLSPLQSRWNADGSWNWMKSSQSTEVDAHELKEHLLKNLGAFSDSAAAFIVCATDPQLPTNESLAWSGHAIAMSEIVETISGHFGDEDLLFAYRLSTFTIAGESDFKLAVRAQTDECSRVALQRAAEFVSDARKIQKRYLTLPSDTLNKHLTGTSQVDSSKTSVPPHLPGETPEQYLKRIGH